jgi:hypothetical protein
MYKENDCYSQKDVLELSEKVIEGIARPVLISQRTRRAVYRQKRDHQEDQYHHPDNPVSFYVPSNLHLFLFIFGFWLLAFGFWLLAFGFWLLAFGFWLLAFGFTDCVLIP